jgi:hypothetical protein
MIGGCKSEEVKAWHNLVFGVKRKYVLAAELGFGRTEALVAGWC